MLTFYGNDAVDDTQEAQAPEELSNIDTLKALLLIQPLMNGDPHPPERQGGSRTSRRIFMISNRAWTNSGGTPGWLRRSRRDSKIRRFMGGTGCTTIIVVSIAMSNNLKLAKGLAQIQKMWKILSASYWVKSLSSW